MADIADNVESILTAVNSLTASVAALTTAVSMFSPPVAPTIDFTPVLTAIAAVAAQLQPTPAAPPAA